MARRRHFHLEAVEGTEPGKHEACVTASNCCRLFQQQGLARSPAEDPSRSVKACDSLHSFALVVSETSLVERSLFAVLYRPVRPNRACMPCVTASLPPASIAIQYMYLPMNDRMIGLRPVVWSRIRGEDVDVEED